MNRKLIILGGQTSVVSLPTSWVKKFNLQKGDDLDVSERGSELVIKTEKKLSLKKITIDARNITDRVLRWALSAAHKSGYDEIDVLYENKNIEKIVNELIKDLFVGFTVLNQTSKKITLKSISRDLDLEFDATLRRAFLVTMSMGEEILKNWDDKIRLNEIKEKEKINNQLTNFCERILITRGYKDSSKTCFVYIIAWNLEKIADEYKYICESNEMISKEVKSYFKKVNNYFKAYYELFYKFDLIKLNKLSESRIELRNKMKSLLGESIVLNHLWEIVNKTTDFSSSIYAIQNGL